MAEIDGERVLDETPQAHAEPTSHDDGASRLHGEIKQAIAAAVGNCAASASNLAFRCSGGACCTKAKSYQSRFYWVTTT